MKDRSGAGGRDNRTFINPPEARLETINPNNIYG